MKLSVQGMTCAHCVSAVTRAVHTVNPEAKVDVDLAKREVTLLGINDAAAVRQAIEYQGYNVTVLEAASPLSSGSPDTRGCCGTCHG